MRLRSSLLREAYPLSFYLPPRFLSSPPAHSVTSGELRLPNELCELYKQANGGEGFYGEQYVRIYPVEQLAELNEAFGTSDFAPGLTIFGSNGGGEAYAYRSTESGYEYLQLPFIPMVKSNAIVLAQTLKGALNVLAGSVPPEESPALAPDMVGIEVHEVQPVVFGGDPVDSSNKAFLQTADYAPYVVWWNQKYREIKASEVSDRA